MVWSRKRQSVSLLILFVSCKYRNLLFLITLRLCLQLPASDLSLLRTPVSMVLYFWSRVGIFFRTWDLHPRIVRFQGVRVKYQGHQTFVVHLLQYRLIPYLSILDQTRPLYHRERQIPLLYCCSSIYQALTNRILLSVWMNMALSWWNLSFLGLWNLHTGSQSF